MLNSVRFSGNNNNDKGHKRTTTKDLTQTFNIAQQRLTEATAKHAAVLSSVDIYKASRNGVRPSVPADPARSSSFQEQQRLLSDSVASKTAAELRLDQAKEKLAVHLLGKR